MNKYEKIDNYGREIIVSLFPERNLTVGSVEDVFDLSGSTPSNFYIEVKTRPDLASNKYDSDILEYHKLANLRKLDKNGIFFYAMIFKDGVIRIYNLNELSILDVHLSNLLCPVSSLDDRGFQNKLIIDLPVSKARTYKYNPPC